VGFGKAVHCIHAESMLSSRMLLSVCAGLHNAVGVGGNAGSGVGAARPSLLERISISPNQLVTASHLVWETSGSTVQGAVVCGVCREKVTLAA